MTELSVMQAWLMLSAILLVFLSGLCWCFCCGTCVGRSMLRNTGLLRFTRDAADNRQWTHLPQNDYDQEEELRFLNTWSEHEEEEEEEEEEREEEELQGRYDNQPDYT
ncbi:unnamed protein product [Mucor circinelloides]